MSKKIEGITKAIKVLKKASKSSSGKESKLEKSAKKIEDMKKDPKFIRLRKRANEIRKKKGLPPKPEFSKGGMLIEGLKKISGKGKKKSRPDLESKAKRKKKMDAEKPAVPTLRRDMRNRVAEKQFKKATGSKPEFRKPVKKSKGGMVTKWEQKWG